MNNTLFPEIDSPQAATKPLSSARGGLSESQKSLNAKRIDEKLEWIKQRSASIESGLGSVLQSPGQSRAHLASHRKLNDGVQFWDDGQRGAPNALIRCGLFGVINSANRPSVKNEKVASLSNYEVTYSGEVLSQDDLSVWLSIVNLARDKQLDKLILFTGYELIKDLDWRMHSESYKRARDCIARLKVTGLQVATKDGGRGYSGSLIRDYAWDHADDFCTNKWAVSLEPKICSLFMPDTTTLVDWEIRRRIGSRATVALWLHMFFSSHQSPRPIPLKTLHTLCKTAQTLSTYRRSVKEAMQRLIDVGFIASFDLVDDILSLKRMPKGIAQARSH